ncbi:hypothetical protein PHMEG_00022723 [Phytophthora megakarya]|uniref:Uncharacterized protein n=1 Tax=Phytophthora megakarya TaxID=4795 RepID=A0A225VHZ3_9STRA|nr:hypothetical protein PHMEG_00022723 [Phytophthora megakarya]
MDGVHYHLNPDLVSDTNGIALCRKCVNDLRKSEFCITSGHENGRPGVLPDLNEMASKSFNREFDMLSIMWSRSVFDGFAVHSKHLLPTSHIHSHFISRGVNVNDSAEARNKIEKLEAKITNSVSVAMSDEALVVDHAVMSESYAEEFTEHTIADTIISRTAVLK